MLRKTHLVMVLIWAFISVCSACFSQEVQNYPVQNYGQPSYGDPGAVSNPNATIAPSKAPPSWSSQGPYDSYREFGSGPSYDAFMHHCGGISMKSNSKVQTRGLKEGLNSVRKKQWGDAAAKFESVVQEDTSSFAAWFLLGVSYEGQLRLYDASKAFERAAAIHPQRALSYLGLMDVAMAAEDWELATYWGNITLSWAPSCTDASFNMTEAFMKLGKYERAEAFARRAIGRYEGELDFRALMTLTDLLIRDGQYGAAENQLYASLGKPKVKRNGEPKFQSAFWRQRDYCDALCSVTHVQPSKQQLLEASARLQEIWRLQKKSKP